MDRASITVSAEPSLDSRALAALGNARNFSTAALRLLLRTKEIVMLAKGVALAEWRDSRDAVCGAFAEHCHAEIKNAELREALEIIRGRIIRMPASHRKRYTPEERYRIVVFVRTYSLSYAEAAELFMIDAQTVGRWIREALREPDRNTIGSLLKASPPLRVVDDVTRELIALLDSLRVGGSKRIAQMLARAGTKISRETVRRYRQRSRGPRPSPLRHERPTPAAVRATAPNQVWMTDITTVPSLLRIWMFKLVVVLDVYSRLPLAFRVFAEEPSSAEIAAVVEEAAERFGRPRHFVTDRGAQFTGAPFVSTLRSLGAQQRFGAIGRTGSIAIIERLWRTTKEMLDLSFTPPLSRHHLEQRVALGLEYYASFRPHQGLAGATPAEIYFGIRPAAMDAAPARPSRARDPADSAVLPFTVVHLDRERRLPILVPTSRAA